MHALTLIKLAILSIQLRFKTKCEKRKRTCRLAVRCSSWVNYEWTDTRRRPHINLFMSTNSGEIQIAAQNEFPQPWGRHSILCNFIVLWPLTLGAGFACETSFSVTRPRNLVLAASAPSSFLSVLIFSPLPFSLSWFNAGWIRGDEPRSVMGVSTRDAPKFWVDTDV